MSKICFKYLDVTKGQFYKCPGKYISLVSILLLLLYIVIIMSKGLLEIKCFLLQICFMDHACR